MLFKIDRIIYFLFIIFISSGSFSATPSSNSLNKLQQAYPSHIHDVSSYYVTWTDGTRMPIQSSFSFIDKIASIFYHLDSKVKVISKKDIQQERYEPIFRKMYGNSAKEVKKHLVTIYWMPKIFGKRYPLKVTTINDVNKKIQRISAALEKLPPSYYKYITSPAGSFYWRNVEGERYLSSHSFGIAIDINSHYSNYWLWDYLRLKRPISELNHHNRIPLKIVEIFAQEGFYWGGNWYYYDTMHFEYRPDLLL